MLVNSASLRAYTADILATRTLTITLILLQVHFAIDQILHNSSDAAQFS